MKRASEDSDEARVRKKARNNGNNDKMHERNKYKENPPDFLALSQKYETFAQYVKHSKKGTATIDFTDPYATRELTKVLLDHDYGIKIELPIDQLCPTDELHPLAGGRAQVLAACARGRCGARHRHVRHVRTTATDACSGTGASCIYPLLGVALNRWSFVATDIDDRSLALAQQNIALNQWQHLIELRKPSEGHILLSVVRPDEDYDFCMCNPPFFGHVDEKGENPQTVCTATAHELATEGGEVEFVSHIIRDSLVLREQVCWYSSMIGRKASLTPLLALLHEHQIRNIRQTTFYQGRTTRWALAWSFSSDGYHQIQRESRRAANLSKKLLAFILPHAQANQVQRIMQRVLDNEQVSYELDQIKSAIFVTVRGGSSAAAMWLEFIEAEANKEENEVLMKMMVQVRQTQEDQVMVTSKLLQGDQHLFVMFFEYLESIFDYVRDVG